LPISTRLAAVLNMARTDPAGDEYGPECFVFGDVDGGRIADVKRAWVTAVLKAHGHTPQWTTGAKLTAVSRAALAKIDLHFHDLRHEAGSRWLEAGWPIHNVSHMLGHTNIAQTSTYLNATRLGLHESMRRFEPTSESSIADTPPLSPTHATPERVGDASALAADSPRCNPLQSEGRREHRPKLQRPTANTGQPLIN
jgi:hypothetical protein